MAVYFLDSSAVVKRYVLETGTAWVHALTDPTAAHTLFLARIAFVELISAVTRRERGGLIPAGDAANALGEFRHDFARQYRIVEITAALIDEAAALARRHGLRAYDAVQMAACLEISAQAPSLTLISADAALNSAAIAEGLAVEDPNSHP